MITFGIFFAIGSLIALFFINLFQLVFSILGDILSSIFDIFDGD